MARAGWTWRRAWPLVGTLLAGLAEPGTASDLRIRGTALEIPTDCAPITIVYEHSADHGCAFFRVNDQHGTQVLHGDCALRNERGHRQSICLPYGSYTFNIEYDGKLFAAGSRWSVYTGYPEKGMLLTTLVPIGNFSASVSFQLPDPAPMIRQRHRHPTRSSGGGGSAPPAAVRWSGGGEDYLTLRLEPDTVPDDGSMGEWSVIEIYSAGSALPHTVAQGRMQRGHGATFSVRPGRYRLSLMPYHYYHNDRPCCLYELLHRHGKDGRDSQVLAAGASDGDVDFVVRAGPDGNVVRVVAPTAPGSARALPAGRTSAHPGLDALASARARAPGRAAALAALVLAPLVLVAVMVVRRALRESGDTSASNAHAPAVRVELAHGVSACGARAAAESSSETMDSKSAEAELTAAPTTAHAAARLTQGACRAAGASALL